MNALGISQKNNLPQSKPPSQRISEDLLRATVAPTPEGDHPDVATAYDSMGTTYRSKGDFDKALELHKKALGPRISLIPIPDKRARGQLRARSQSIPSNTLPADSVSPYGHLCHTVHQYHCKTTRPTRPVTSRKVLPGIRPKSITLIMSLNACQQPGIKTRRFFFKKIDKKLSVIKLYRCPQIF